jgi:hypothetical protein
VVANPSTQDRFSLKATPEVRSRLASQKQLDCALPTEPCVVSGIDDRRAPAPKLDVDPIPIANHSLVTRRDPQRARRGLRWRERLGDSHEHNLAHL